MRARNEGRTRISARELHFIFFMSLPLKRQFSSHQLKFHARIQLHECICVYMLIIINNNDDVQIDVGKHVI
jgi:hypothetical protein